MRFYLPVRKLTQTGTKQHKYYCGVDLHARSMYLCILNQDGDVVYHRNHRAEPKQFLKAINPFREDLVVAVECMFCWYWIADLCSEHGINRIRNNENQRFSLQDIFIP